MTETKNEVVVRSLERVKFWEWNPRGSNYRGMPELVSSLAREGLQDAIHVWERVDGDYLLKWHSRQELHLHKYVATSGAEGSLIAKPALKKPTNPSTSSTAADPR
jgi:hypothetical protein